MQMTSIIIKAFLIAILLHTAQAHPGHDAIQEAKARRAYMQSLSSRDLSHCTKLFERTKLREKAIARRSEVTSKLRLARGIKDASDLQARDLISVLATNHHSNLTTLNVEASESIIFGKEHAAILSPETRIGPFYVDGELIRSNITENQKGIDLVIDVQLINYRTCEPITNIAVDLWHCNATGIYSGIVDPKNGNAKDLPNINSTWFRGVQVSDNNGVVAFQTKMPGHYGDRTNHIHVLSHHNVSFLPNRTITGGYSSHVGQIYFDQWLLDAVEKTEVYASTTLPRTMNANDHLMVGAAEGDDPVMQYVLLGKEVADGIFGWIDVGIDPIVAREVYAAASYASDGGHPNTVSSYPAPTSIRSTRTSASFSTSR